MAWRERGSVGHGEPWVRQATCEDVVYGQQSGEQGILWSDRVFSIMVRRQGMPRWADDTVQRLKMRQREGTRGRSRTPSRKEIGRREGGSGAWQDT